MRIIPIEMSRIDEFVLLWNTEWGTEFPMRKELFKQNSVDDENVFLKASFMAVNENEEVVGIIICKRWQEELAIEMNRYAAWIQVLLVSSEYQGKGIGTSLLTHAEQAVLEDGATEILLGRDPWHYFPGIPVQAQKSIQWFERKGYQNISTDYDLIKIYQENEFIEKPRFHNVEAELLTLAEKEEFLQFLKRVFPGRWEYEAIHYFDKGGTGREFVVLKKEGRIIGFSRLNDQHSPMIAQNVYWAPLFREPLGGIGPLGIDQGERGNGYGLSVVQAACYFLRERKINRIVIDWTGLVNFYAKLGYEIWKEYKSYRKPLVDHPTP